MKRITLLLIALGVMVIGCKKDPDESKDDSKNGTGVCRIKSVSADANVNRTTFEYDANGKIVRETHSDGDYTTYSIESGEVVVREYSSTGQLKLNLDTRIYILNPEGYIGKTVDTHPGDTDTHIFTYSPEGYQIKEEVFDYKGKLESTYNFTVVDGNTVKIEYINASNGNKRTDVYTFLQVENKAGLGGFPRGEGGLAQYYGKTDKNLMNTLTYSNGTTLSMEYQMDGDLVKYMKVNQPGFPTVVELWYTYENCE